MPFELNEETPPGLKSIKDYFSSFQSPPKNNVVVYDRKEKEEFQRRVATFEVGLWAIPEVSPLYCSRYGWYLYNSEILKCSTCKTLLCTKLPSNNLSDTYKKFLKTLKNEIVFGHKEFCYYENHSNPIEFAQPSFQLFDLKHLSSETKRLCEIGKGLPHIKRADLLKKLDLNEYQISSLFKLGDQLDEMQLTSAILTLFGWTFKTQSILKCSFCLRTVGLWKYFALEDGALFRRYEKRCQKRLRNKEKEEAQLRLMKQQKKEDIISELNVSLQKQEEERRVKQSENEMNFVELENTAEDIFEEDSLLNESNVKQSNSVTEADRCLPSFSPNSNLNVSGNPQKEKTGDGKSQCVEANRRTFSSYLCSVLASIEKEDSNAINKEDLNSINKEDSNSNDALSLNSTVSNNSTDSVWTELLPVEKPSPSSLTFCNFPNEDKADICPAVSHEDNLSGAAKDEDTSEFPQWSLELQNNRKRSHSDSDEESAISPNPKRRNEGVSSSLSKVSETLSRKRARSSSDDEESPVGPIPKRQNDEQGDTENTEPIGQSDVTSSEEEEELKDEDSRVAFDPLSEHRYWCGWLWEAKNKQQMTIPGYLIIPKELKRITPCNPPLRLSKDNKYASNVEGLRSIRKILDDCTCPATSQDAERMEV